MMQGDDKKGDDDKIVMTADLGVPIAQVWHALTDYKAFGQWFGVDLDQPFEAGVKSTGCMTLPDHAGVPWVVYVDRIEPEHVFAFHWYDSEDGEAGDSHEHPQIWVVFEFKDIPEGTRLTITESGFAAFPEPYRGEIMKRNAEGWAIQVQNLTRYLSAGPV